MDDGVLDSVSSELKLKIKDDQEQATEATFKHARLSAKVRKTKAADHRFLAVVRRYLPDAFFFCQNERCSLPEEVRPPDELRWIENKKMFMCHLCTVGMIGTEFAATLEDVMEGLNELE